MNLKSLLLCADDKIVRVLRRTLGDLDISVDLCADSETALRKLTRERYEAIIVDCAGAGAGDVLRCSRSSPGNKRAVAVAILDADNGMRSAFAAGANFVLHKPVSVEKAKSSFRAARALMKKERRRNARVAVNIPVEMSSRESGARFKVSTTDLGEGGVAISLPKRSKPKGRWEISFTLPGATSPLQVDAEFAWEGIGTQVGLRFHDQTPEFARQLQEWLRRNSPDIENDDPPVRCQLTDLTLGGCYLEIASPFPVSTRVTLSLKAVESKLRVEGIVRVMHPEKGMGVEFSQKSAEHRSSLEKFMAKLAESRDVLPEVLVEPEGLGAEIGSPESSSLTADAATETEDMLLNLFRTHATVAADLFLVELRKQRGLAAAGVSA